MTIEALAEICRAAGALPLAQAFEDLTPEEWRMLANGELGSEEELPASPLVSVGISWAHAERHMPDLYDLAVRFERRVNDAARARRTRPLGRS
jgi:hypothetical protein